MIFLITCYSICMWCKGTQEVFFCVVVLIAVIAFNALIMFNGLVFIFMKHVLGIRDAETHKTETLNGNSTQTDVSRGESCSLVWKCVHGSV